MAVGVVLGQVGAVQTVNNKLPDPLGNVDIEAKDINAIPATNQSVVESYLASNSVSGGKIKSGAVSASFSLTIPTSTVWNTDGLGLYTDLALSGILASDKPIVDIKLDNVASNIVEGLMEEYNKIYSVVATSGHIRFRVTEKLTKAITLQLVCIRK